jgi:hypothetical protein
MANLTVLKTNCDGAPNFFFHNTLIHMPLFFIDMIDSPSVYVHQV